MKHSAFCFVLILSGVFTGAHASTVAQQSNQPLSKYGQIQNVQNYSSNPFWNPNGPYNQRMPTPVYVQGADMNAGDCQRVVAQLVAQQCATRNNCTSTQLSEIRPSIMLQLSRLPGHNYASSCAGFIDSEFADYVAKYGNAAMGGVNTAFPTATTPNPNVGNTGYTFKMPEKQVPDWAQEMRDRDQELQDLQSQNGAGNAGLTATSFPTTYSDLSFSQRMANAAAGYAPYKDAKAYLTMNIETEEEYYTRMQQIQANKTQYCLTQNERYGVLSSDLEQLRKCRDANIPFAECKTRGHY